MGDCSVFKFPKFPLDETKVIKAMPKDTEEGIVRSRKADLNKIVKYLLRQTYIEDGSHGNECMDKLMNLSFWEFLFEVGMFEGNKSLNTF